MSSRFLSRESWRRRSASQLSAEAYTNFIQPRSFISSFPCVGYNVGLVAYECQHYRLLTERDRNLMNRQLLSKCDNNLAEGWYRISGGAGAQMPIACPGPGRCNTEYPGWLFGSHPHKDDGCVERMVCFGDYVSGCCNHRRKVLVRNCGEFYVYKLGPTPGCNFRYCGRDAPASNMDGLWTADFRVTLVFKLSLLRLF